MERDEYNLKRWKEKRGEEGKRGRGPKEEGARRGHVQRHCVLFAECMLDKTGNTDTV